MDRPTLLSRCTFAATASEARFRIDGPPHVALATRVLAIDPGASRVLDETRRTGGWRSARFGILDTDEGSEDGRLVVADLTHALDAAGAGGVPARAGSRSLSDELEGADVVLLVATTNEAAEVAGIVGEACARRGIMTAGLVVLGPDTAADETVAMLRPHARVLLVSDDPGDLTELLLALRA